MNTLEAIQIIEDGDAPTEETYYEAWQCLIDSGIVWRLQGYYGRTAEALIDAGECTRAYG